MVINFTLAFARKNQESERLLKMQLYQMRYEFILIHSYRDMKFTCANKYFNVMMNRSPPNFGSTK